MINVLRDPLVIGSLLSMACISIYPLVLGKWFLFISYLFGTGFILFGFYGRTKASESGDFGWRVSSVDRYFLSSIFVAGLILFSGVGSYPSSLVGDAIRDGGLNVGQLLNGTLRDPFAWGRYSSHGLIIAALNIPFYWMFGSNLTAIQAAGGMIGVASVWLLYFTTKSYFGSLSAFLASCGLLGIPVFLYFSRTELVIAWSFFWSIFLIKLACDVVTKFSRDKLFFYCFILGVASGFHAGVRAYGLALMVVQLIVLGWSFRGKVFSCKVILLHSLWALLFFFLGFGPRIYSLNSDVFFKRDRLYSSQQDGRDRDELRRNEAVEQPDCELWCRYRQTLGGLIVHANSNSSHFKSKGPLISSITTSGLAVLGFIVILFKKRFRVAALFLGVILMVSFTNGAATTLIGSDHRMAPLVPLFAILSGIGASGVVFMLSYLSKSLVPEWVIALICSIICLAPAYRFFIERHADRFQVINDFHLYSALPIISQLIKDDPRATIFIDGSADREKYLSLLFVHELLWYHFPKTKFAFGQCKNPALSEATIQIATSCLVRNDTDGLFLHKSCNDPSDLTCPSSGLVGFNYKLQR